MRILLFSILFLCTHQGISQNTSLKQGNHFRYFEISPNSSDTSQLLVFLHGSIKYYVNDGLKEVKFDQLFEGNQHFLKAFKKYKIIIPIAHSGFNWLDTNSHTLFYEQILENQSYDKVVISGFSDGGTGAYKLFYSHPEWFDALVMFNGYPQHKWFSKKVDYSKVQGKHTFFISSKKDEVIPYEFCMAAYREQAIYNYNSYLYLEEGGHAFGEYKAETFNQIARLLETKPYSSDEVVRFIPIDGFTIGNMVYQVYPFRKKMAKRYGFNKDYYQFGYSVKECKKINEFLTLQQGYYQKSIPEITPSENGYQIKLKFPNMHFLKQIPDYRLVKPF